MTIEYNVTEEDYINLTIHHSEHSKYAKSLKLMTVYGIPALTILIFVFGLRTALGFDIVPVYVVAVVLALLWVVLFPKFYLSTLKRIIKRHISEGKNNDFIGYQKLTLKDDSIEAITVNSTILTQYTAVERIEYGYNCLFVYIGAIQAIIIPLSAFGNIEQRNNFIEILKQKTGVTAPIEIK